MAGDEAQGEAAGKPFRTKARVAARVGPATFTVLVQSYLTVSDRRGCFVGEKKSVKFNYISEIDGDVSLDKPEVYVRRGS